MYFDSKPCAVCGSEIELRARRPSDDSDGAGTSGPVGEPDGVVGDADPTVDERVCTNADCPTRNAGGPAA